MVEKTLRLIRGYDWTLMVVVFLLTAIGLSAIYSVDLSKGNTLIYFPVQTIAFVLGVLVLLFAASVHSVFYQSFSRIAYLGVLLLLVAVLFWGATIRGTTGWFRLFGFSLQPAELAKYPLFYFCLGSFIGIVANITNGNLYFLLFSLLAYMLVLFCYSQILGLH